MDARIVFMGSPDFALPSLEELHKAYRVVGVFTQPDRPAGRGRQTLACPVKQVAQSLDLPIYQPSSLRTPEALAKLAAWDPDLVVVAAYGRILPRSFLTLPEKGCINVHASLLPRWRGASPIQAAIAAGDERSGVTIMQMEAGLDTGPILAQREVPIRTGTSADILSQQLAFLGAKTLIDILPSYLNNMLAPMPQNEAEATYAPILKKSDGLLDFSLSALELSHKVQAYHPWPGTFFFLDGKQVKVLEAHVHDSFLCEVGEHYIVNGSPAIGTSAGFLVLDQVQVEGKKSIRGTDFLNGQTSWLEESGD